MLGDSKPRDPVLVESLCDRDSFHVFDGDNLWPAGKPVHHGQQVLESLGFRKWPYQINMDVVKSAGGWLEGLQGCSDMGLNLGPLAAQAGVGLLGDLLI